MSFFCTDCRSALSQMKRQEEELMLKRRWLIGSASRYEQNNSKESKFLNSTSLSESLLRGDDVFYECVRSYIEMGYSAVTSRGANCVVAVDDGMQLFKRHNMVQVLPPLLDHFTNVGLYRVATILTGGSCKSLKTRKKMKRLIREHLSKFSENQSGVLPKMDLLRQLSQLLMDPKYFQKHHMMHRTAATECHKILDGIEDLPFEALKAMHRKLRGDPSCAPKFRPPKSGWSRDRLLKRVKESSLKMLAELGEGNELPEPLAKALEIANLSMKLSGGDLSLTTAVFYQFSPERKALQNNIIKAVWLIKKKVIRAPELETLIHVFDPDAEIACRSMRAAIVKLLTEFLFECGYFDSIPRSLVDALNIINKRAQRLQGICSSGELIDEEVECVLSIAAHLKQILWDSLLNDEFDQDYADAYMEDSEESDWDGDFGDKQDFVEGIDEVGSTRTPSRTGSPAHGSGDATLNCPSVDRKANTISNLVDHSSTSPSDHTRKKEIFMCEKQNTSANCYLTFQEACDRTSLVAHRLVGRTLELFAEAECLGLDLSAKSYLRSNNLIISEDFQVIEKPQTTLRKVVDKSVIVQAIEDVMPSFCKSDVEKLKELMGVH